MSSPQLWRTATVAGDDAAMRVLAAWYQGERNHNTLAIRAHVGPTLLVAYLERLTAAGLLLEGEDPPVEAVTLLNAHVHRQLTGGKKR